MTRSTRKSVFFTWLLMFVLGSQTQLSTQAFLITSNSYTNSRTTISTTTKTDDIRRRATTSTTTTTRNGGHLLHMLPIDTEATTTALISNSGAAWTWIADSTLAVQSADMPQPLSNTATIAIFAAGLVPFIVATVEFWRRIAVGESFGTGSDSVVIIGEDDAPESSRGRRVLGKGALVTAYILFALAFGVLALVLVSVVTSGPLPMELPSMTSVASTTELTP